MNKRAKNIIITLIVLILLAAGVVGFFYVRYTNQTVNVYNVSELAMTDYWGDTNTTWGQVYTDRMQTVFVSETQEVTEVYVQPGQQVHEGDPIMAYDTTLSDLELNRKELIIQELQEELKDTKKEYNELVGAQVYTVAAEPADTNAGSGTMRLSPDAGAAERAQFGALLWKTNTEGETPTEQPPAEQTPETEEGAPTENEGETETTPEPEQTPSVVDGVVQTYHLVGGSGTEEDPYLYLTAVGIPFDPAILAELIPPKEPDPDAIPDPTPPPETYYIVFAQSEENRVDGDVIAAAGICFTEDEETEDGFLFTIFDAADRLGYELGGEPPEEETPPPDDDEENNNNNNNNNGNNNNNNNNNTNNNGSNNNNNNNNNSNNNNNNNNNNVSTGPSYAEIQQMKAELQRRIKELDLRIRIEQVEFKRMQQEVSDGMVYAELDGIVTDVLDADTAFEMQEAIIKISGGGMYYVEGTISELSLESIAIGQQVTIRSWESFGEYIGTIESIADYPSSNGGYTDGNTNVSYYPFVVAVDASANLREGEGVDMEITEATVKTDAFYLEQPFLLRENGKSYVYVTGAEGTLEKREITTGVTVWGTYVQVVDGLTLEDTIAFPYGRLIREGIKTTPSTLDELYNW